MFPVVHGAMVQYNDDPTVAVQVLVFLCMFGRVQQRVQRVVLLCKRKGVGLDECSEESGCGICPDACLSECEGGMEFA
jgi:hypothetical protein